MNHRTEAEKALFFHRNYAHRGLYDPDNGIPENSLPAFQNAVDHGFGIELDVQLSKDGEVMVFHDDNLKRMTGKDALIWDLTFEELRTLRLGGTEETIPTFREVLDVLKAGEGHHVIEIKTGPRNNELSEKTYAMLKDFPGVYCVESFNPFIVNWFRKNAPEVFRGQLATGIREYKAYPKIIGKMLVSCRFSFLNRPDFIAYDKSVELPKHVNRLRKKGVMLFAWTCRNEKEASEAERNYDGVIFERYLPKLTY
ncbi:MAG: glycerophosphodiester phosphodiesterase [Lachnospiraceae bacterium]|nr:glycerophosphodiester phosphodiesterase [Lachnospiraceae bacterium]